MAKVDDVKGCYGDGTNNTDTALFTLTNASKNNVLPRGWCGQFVRIRPVGANAWYYFTKVKTAVGSAATIAASPAASDAGTQAATQGEYIPNGEVQHVFVPNVGEDESVFFVRIGDAATQGIYLTKASGVPGNNLESGR